MTTKPPNSINVLAYYFLTPIADPRADVAKHLAFFQSRDVSSRIYISEEGINGQMSASRCAAKEYMDWLRSDPRFQEVRFKIHSTSEHPFPKKTVKYRKQLVAFDRTVNLDQRGQHVSPEIWQKMLAERDAHTLVLDVRNGYEWDVGHFEGALRPACDSFREFPVYAEQLKTERNPQETVVMMYCTGGIRCEYYSAFLKEKGFSHVYQLDGGIIQYGMDQGSDQWQGKLFVFDDRLVIPLSSEESTPISHCKHCNTSIDVYHNCANMDCNELFICCIPCLHEWRGCCREECTIAPRVRPYRQDGSAKPFRSQTETLSCCTE